MYCDALYVTNFLHDDFEQARRGFYVKLKRQGEELYCAENQRRNLRNRNLK